MAILAQLFMVALIDGQLKDLHHFGTILTALNDVTLEALPYPLGSTRLGCATQVEQAGENNHGLPLCAEPRDDPRLQAGDR